MERVMLQYRGRGVSGVVFGDIFLRDLRAYRERRLAEVDMQPIFPLWQRDTNELIHTFIDCGFKAFISCVDAEKLGRAFAGRAITRGLLADLPPGVDPCGENGEFHSFVHDGPIFQRAVGISVGDVVRRDSRYFADLLPAAPQFAQPTSTGCGR